MKKPAKMTMKKWESDPRDKKIDKVLKIKEGSKADKKIDKACISGLSTKKAKKKGK